MKIAIMVGTRPEAIKMAPIVKAFRAKTQYEIILCSTGQHKDMLAQALQDFGLVPDVDLGVMTHGQTLAQLTENLMNRLASFYESFQPDWVFVQGDTTTVFVASLVAFYHKVKVAHVEAGLRSFDKFSPFPEEVNRKLTSVLADVHFTPTSLSKANLLAEGVAENRVVVTGNTVIDALLSMRDSVQGKLELLPATVKGLIEANKKIVLCTTHRRENWGKPLHNICSALLDVVAAHEDVSIVLPVHLNPVVRNTIEKRLGGHERIVLIAPQPYRNFVLLMSHAHVILSDSGGVQEEAPSLDVPVLIMRDNTERPEGVESGVTKLVGTQRFAISSALSTLLQDKDVYQKMVATENPYGNGTAARQIVEFFKNYA
ncbi:non-hydrolyzing UDP-N-acetylglucosamine 2-epimerase [Oleidesulfovibrio alaskensis]|jgi:UDP-N-acetylglucosamine 2-epimerase|uniref:non-hydrolyzing UDP-N-acetylglucosamine 2-epimerase n=1 Tax=Oleidesulfovibrio alaskensis TaxID=58180 RepID=UPI001A5DBF25|nr:UDP-N-acetylglucosamine 2-epimerase (non-hydrolyzing) [Oleidesulfovibrio alaskensis]MBL3583590.1 UDP-N-acetylglucosamine 2-epimerase (non-hydrolyzing) [Oleidesulfovibrio alaskensis]